MHTVHKQPRAINIPVDQIIADDDVQARVGTDPDVVAEYAAVIDDGGTFPPLIVFHDKSANWLADGFHRLAAYRRNGKTSVQCEVREGSKDDAIAFACSADANGRHGLRRTTADKRRAVELMLELHGDWTDGRLAAHIGVDAKTVGKYRSTQEFPESRVGRDGRTINISNIGRKPAGSDPAPSIEAVDEHVDEADDKRVRAELAEMLGLSVQDTIDADFVKAANPALFEKVVSNEISLAEAKKEIESAREPAAEPAVSDEPATTGDEPDQPVPVAEPADADDPEHDEEGHAIPPDLQEVFARRAEFGAIMRRISDLKAELLEMCQTPAGGHLRPQEVEARANNLRTLVKFSTPHSVCPYCGGSKCDTCRRTGWMPKDVYDRVPAELKIGGAK